MWGEELRYQNIFILFALIEIIFISTISESDSAFHSILIRALSCLRVCSIWNRIALHLKRNAHPEITKILMYYAETSALNLRISWSEFNINNLHTQEVDDYATLICTKNLIVNNICRQCKHSDDRITLAQTQIQTHIEIRLHLNALI